MKNFSNYTDYDKKRKFTFRIQSGTWGARNGTIDRSSEHADFPGSDLQTSGTWRVHRLCVQPSGEPYQTELERTMAILEGGIKAFAFSSGQSCKYGCIFSAESGRPCSSF